MWDRDPNSKSIPIVQGVAVSSPSQQKTYAPATAPPPYNYTTVHSSNINSGAEYNGLKGQSQPKKFNDVFFGVLFYIHLFFMAVLLVAATSDGGGYYQKNGGDYSGIIFCVSACGVFAAGLSSLTLGFMMSCATELVKLSLFFSIGTSLAMGILGLMAGQMLMGILGLVSFAFGCCYAYYVWDRIPFAAANLNTALTAVRANMGLSVVAYLFLAIAVGWSIWWSIAAEGFVNAYGSGVLFLFLLSYYWTHQVLQNTVHVTTAGVIGTWWFVPHEASSCCSRALGDSFTRATTYSFGSICFGSLLVALVQALRALNRQLRENEDFSIVVCLIDCILGCIEGIIEYLNKWAYVYVGLYGYNYIEAGKNVMTLFQNKGWTTIITDDLADNVLFMNSVGVALITGFVGYIVAKMGGFEAYDNPGSIGFFIGLLVGLVISSILMGVVGSAVNTVIVCFAEAPQEFEMNHPELSSEMRSAWRQAWPEECSRL